MSSPQESRRATARLGPRPRPVPAVKAAAVSLVLAAVAALLVMLARSILTKAPLKPDEIGHSLSDDSNRSATNRALLQVAEEISRGDSLARQWYPAVVRLASVRDPALRQTSAWVMGRDPKSGEFHQALLELIRDPVPLVRWNAALVLLNFGDPAGRPQFHEMLRPYTLMSPGPGVLRYKIREHSLVDSSKEIAVLQDGEHTMIIPAPMSGLFDQRLAVDGGEVAAGDAIALLQPGQEQVFEALRALSDVGLPEDLPDVGRYDRSTSGMPENVQRQAKATADAIQKRSGSLRSLAR